MDAFNALSAREQLRRLRRLAETALSAYGIEGARLTTLAHLENTTFRVDAPGGDRYVLRIHRTTGSPAHPPRSVEEVRSETRWLAALREEAGLAVPAPATTADGATLTVAEADGVPTPRICVLFRWRDGRFLDAGLTPLHLIRVGRLIGRLHAHARHYAPPDGFVRWRVGDLNGDAAAFVVGEVAEHAGAEAAALVERVLDLVDEARRELGEGPDVFGLIHADLHQENYLFRRDEASAIDFDDCGWGHFAYDLAVTLSELRGRPGDEELRTALLAGYRTVRPFPPRHERFVELFHGLRMLLLTLWFLEQRDHPSFPDWRVEFDDGLAELRAFVDRVAPAR